MAPNLNSDDYYQILGVPRDADDAALKKAYKKLAVKWHPDKNPGNDTATKNFQKVSEAYATLSDSKKRQIYDQHGKDAANQADQMGDAGAHGHGFPGGGFGGFRPGGGGGGGTHHMSQEDADRIFSHIFGGGDPFGSGFGSMGGGTQIRFGGTRGPGRTGGDPLEALFGGMGGMHPGMAGMGGMHPGMGGMHQGMGGFGGHPGFQQRARPQPKRYDTIPNGTMVSLRGLVSRPDRNGDRGQVQSFDPSSGRYVVVLEDTEETMKVKPTNLIQHVHVTVHGLESRPDLNGQQATVLAWDNNKERFNIYVNAKAMAISLKPSNVKFQNGTVAQISGLKAKPELNGKWGTIKSWNSTTQRYDIQLSESQVIRIKMDNIRL